MSYDMIDRFLRNNLGDEDYAEYSAALDSLVTPPAPPQREWVGLTEAEASKCWDFSAIQTWKNIEAKLWEKNHVS
jgi:hypothetical protein